MKTNKLIRVTGPGLPPYPKLMFDPKNRRAIVSVRHPTWQSHEWAIHATALVVWAVTGLLVFFAWKIAPDFEIVFKVMVFLFATVILYNVVNFLLHRSLRYFLARRVFATRTIFWFTSEAIAFRSRLYAKPVIVWRKWHSLPVRVRFILLPDRDVLVFSNSLSSKRKVPSEHLHESRMLEIVLTTVDRQRDVNLNGQDTILRTIPITEIDNRLATKFTMVYAAAVMLTASVQTPIESESKGGVDIDAV